MRAAEYERHKKEIDEQAKNLAREVRKIHAGTDEGTLRRKAEDQKRREEREACLHAADVLEKRIKCSTVECPEDNILCSFRFLIWQNVNTFSILNHRGII